MLGPFELLERTPEPDASNVWFYAPIRLTFSVPLDPSTVDASAFTVTVAKRDLQKTIELSDDGTAVTILLQSPPVMAATATLDIGDTLHDASGRPFAGESWTYGLPLWQSPGDVGAKNAESPSVALDASDAPIVASNAAGKIVVRGLREGTWEAFGAALNGGGNADGAPSVVAGDQPLVAFAEDGDVSVQGWDGSTWAELGEPMPAGVASADPVLALDSAGKVLLAHRSGDDAIEVKRWSGTAWQAVATLSATGPLGGFALAANGTTPVLAYYDENADLALAAAVASDFVELAPPFDRVEATSGGRPSLAVSANEVFVAYLDDDGGSQTAFVRNLSAGVDPQLQAFGVALDLVLDADAFSPAVAVSADGQVNVAWSESYAGVTKTLVARFVEDRLEILGPALDVSEAAGAGVLSLALDSHGNPTLSRTETGVTVDRYNGSPQTPFGLRERATTSACQLPADDAANFPATLAATGCYADVAKQQLIAGALPFELNSPLWSDGAAKRRYIVLPDGKNITPTPTGAWQMPVGSIVIKEFWYEKVVGDPASLFPMETRFLIKRCEEDAGCVAPLQGYSYQWNDAGTEATLLKETDCVGTTQGCKVVAWPVTGGALPTHSHVYPSRANCLRCHNVGAGRFLGIQTAQLNRPHEFAEAIDNQIRTFENIGAFGGNVDDHPALERLPQPGDASGPLQQRAQAYFQANCAHCHNPQGEQQTIDFRFQGAGLTATNICDKLVPGSPLSSPLYNRDSSRGASQMPPIASLIADARQLPVTAAWITSMTACP